MKQNRLLNNISYFPIAFFLIIIWIYIIINGENIIIPLWDNLDSEVAWLKMLQDNHLFFNYHDQVPFLHGIDRAYLYSPAKAYIWLYIILPNFWAFVTGWSLKIIISICGFNYLCNTLKLNRDITNKNIFTFCGFLYGLTPTWPVGAFYFASLPFLLAFIINYYKYKHYRELFLLLIYPVFSDFSRYGIFILGYLLAFIIFDSLITKKIKWYMFNAVLALTIGYLITEWNLFHIMLFTDEETIRSEFVLPNYSFSEELRIAMDALIWGHAHSISSHAYIVMPVCLLYFVYLCLKKRDNSLFKDYYFYIICVIIFNAMIYGFNSDLRRIFGELIPVLHGLNLGRTLWFNGFLWYFAFAVVICRIGNDFRFGYTREAQITLLIYAFISLLAYKSPYNMIKHNFDYVIHRAQTNCILNVNTNITYKQFYAEELFAKIKKEINYKGEWSVSNFIFPAVLEYNQIKTIDGMLSYYPLKYKNQFRKLIRPVLLKNKIINDFNSWGARAYIFSKDFDWWYGCNTEPMRQEYNMFIDSEIFRQMGGKYVFSRVKIINNEDLNLSLIKKFEDADSIYDVYVYKLNGVD